MKLRRTNIKKLGKRSFDVLIIGGGINGAVAAASLSARGVKAALIDRADFASATSSNSSNLAWGGIKYLESYEFLLVNKLCKSRNQLMKSYPSTVKEIRFLTAIEKGFRHPPGLVYLGTLLYWVMGRFATRAPRYLNPAAIAKRDSAVSLNGVAGGFEYSDCYLYDNDARFVFNFVRTAMNYGCAAANYVESLGSERRGDQWLTRARDTQTGELFTIESKALINACGPQVDAHNALTGQQTTHRHVFSKGIHLIVDRISDTERVLTFFASDGRLFFVIPMGPKTCIGTTDSQVETPDVEVSDADRQFVLDNANTMLNLDKPLTRADIIAERCGVRPLAVSGGDSTADWVELSRKHAIDVNTADQHLSIFGGKLTDCINVGEEVCDIIEDLGIAFSHRHRRWYGEPADSIKAEFMHQAKLMQLDAMTDLSSSEPLTERLWRRYGRNAIDMLERIREKPSRAKLLIENAEYLRCEVEHTARTEMVTTLEDFLRRRSKIAQVVRHDELINSPGLRKASRILFGQQAEAKLAEYIRTHQEPDERAADHHLQTQHEYPDQ